MKPADRLSIDSQLMYVFLHTPVATLFSKSKHLVISATCRSAYEHAKRKSPLVQDLPTYYPNVNVDISTRLTTMHGCHGLLVFNLLT